MQRLAMACGFLLVSACSGEEDRSLELQDHGRSLELQFEGDGVGTVHVFVNELLGTGEVGTAQVECHDSCRIDVFGDALLQISVEEGEGSNFLGWDNEEVPIGVCYGIGACELFLYDDYELSVELSQTHAAIEIIKDPLGNLPLEYETSGGSGACNVQECLVVAEVGTEVTLRVPEPEDPFAVVTWTRPGTCDGGALCMVDFAEGPEIVVPIDSNQHLGVGVTTPE